MCTRLREIVKKCVEMCRKVEKKIHIALRRCEILWSGSEIALMALSAEQARHTENVFHIALTNKYMNYFQPLSSVFISYSKITCTLFILLCCYIFYSSAKHSCERIPNFSGFVSKEFKK